MSQEQPSFESESLRYPIGEPGVQIALAKMRYEQSHPDANFEAVGKNDIMMDWIGSGGAAAYRAYVEEHPGETIEEDDLTELLSKIERTDETLH